MTPMLRGVLGQLPLVSPSTRQTVADILKAKGISGLVTLANSTGEQIHVPMQVASRRLNSASGLTGDAMESRSSEALRLNLADLQQLQNLIQQKARQIQMQNVQLAALLEAQQTILQNTGQLQQQVDEEHRITHSRLWQEIVARQQENSQLHAASAAAASSSMSPSFAVRGPGLPIGRQQEQQQQREIKGESVLGEEKAWGACYNVAASTPLPPQALLLPHDDWLGEVGPTSTTEPHNGTPSSDQGGGGPAPVTSSTSRGGGSTPVVQMLHRGGAHLHQQQATGGLDRSADNMTLEELEDFARAFKQRRIDLGFNQTDIGMALGKLYGADFSQTTISRFEALNLSYKNMVKLKPLLDRLLADVEAIGAVAVMQRVIGSSSTDTDAEAPLLVEVKRPADNKIESPEQVKKRRCRTTIDPFYLDMLFKKFNENPHPSGDQLTEIAETVDMDREIVRIWFGNHRQKLKKARNVKGETPYSQCTSGTVFPISTTEPCQPATLMDADDSCITIDSD